MQCPSCGGEMTTTRETYHYTDSGLSNIDLHDTEIRRCPSCGEEEVIIPAAESLHRSIAQQLAAKRGKLAPEEIRFLRKQLGFSGVDLAAHMGVAPETVSRWENGGQEIGPVADRLLRLLAITAGTSRGLRARDPACGGNRGRRAAPAGAVRQPPERAASAGLVVLQCCRVLNLHRPPARRELRTAEALHSTPTGNRGDRQPSASSMTDPRKEPGIAIGQVFLEETAFSHRKDALALPPSTKPEIGDVGVEIQAGVSPDGKMGIVRVRVTTKDEFRTPSTESPSRWSACFTRRKANKTCRSGTSSQGPR